MSKIIEQLKLRIQILQIQLQILLLKKKLTVPNLPNPRHILVHHGGGDWDFWQVNNHHINKWGKISSLGYGLGYHYWIELDGTLFQARRDNEEAAHCVEPSRPHYWNKNALSVCLRGNTEIDRPTDAQSETLKNFINQKKAQYNLTNREVLGHREIVPTICPGKYLWEWLVRNYPSFGKTLG